MAMVHPAPIDPSIIQAGAASAEIAAVAHTGIINNPKYYWCRNRCRNNLHQILDLFVVQSFGEEI